MDLHKLLEERERRWGARLDMARTHQCAVLSLTLNIPGPDKNLPGAEAASARLWECLCRGVKGRGGAILEQRGLSGLDGPCWLAAVRMDAPGLKAIAVEMEDAHPLGRLADADVMDAEGHPVGRQDVGRLPRRCFLCGRQASLCRREGCHSQSALLDFVRGLLDGPASPPEHAGTQNARAGIAPSEAVPHGRA